jgi:hypothetical protein
MNPEINDGIFVHQLNSNVDMATYPHLVNFVWHTKCSNFVFLLRFGCSGMGKCPTNFLNI